MKKLIALALLAACAEHEETPTPPVAPQPPTIRLRADVKYTGNEPYNDDPINYEGFLVYEKIGHCARVYIELSDGKKPQLRILQDESMLTVVNEKDLIIMESETPPDDPSRWRPWTLLVHPIGPNVVSVFEIFDDKPPGKEHRLKARRESRKTWMKEAWVTVDPLHGELPISLISQNLNATTDQLDLYNVRDVDVIESKLFDVVPALKSVRNRDGTPKYLIR